MASKLVLILSNSTSYAGPYHGVIDIDGDDYNYSAWVEAIHDTVNRHALHHKCGSVYIAINGIISSPGGYEYMYDPRSSVQHIITLMCALRYYDDFASRYYKRGLTTDASKMPKWDVDGQHAQPGDKSTVVIDHGPSGVHIEGLVPTRSPNGLIDLRWAPM